MKPNPEQIVDRLLNEYAFAGQIPDPKTPDPQPPQKTVNWTPGMLARFKVAYKAAYKQGDKNSTFIFDGNEFVVSYAKYLIQFLDSQFGSS